VEPVVDGGEEVKPMRTTISLHTISIEACQNRAMIKQQIHIAGLAAVLVGGSWAVAGAQSAPSTSTSPATGGMDSRQHDRMVNGSSDPNMRINSSAMGNGAVKMCGQMMTAMSRDPKLRQEMDHAMSTVTSKNHTK
jgi:hypothetical protein